MAGGLTAGVVQDARTRTGVNGAVVAEAGSPNTRTVTVATPEDPAVGDGLFTLFSPASGARTLWVTASGYKAGKERAVVRADRVVWRSIRLTAE